MIKKQSFGNSIFLFFKIFSQICDLIQLYTSDTLSANMRSNINISETNILVDLVKSHISAQCINLILVPYMSAL